jgi:Fuc2NAc and GlcNAc transferase
VVLEAGITLLLVGFLVTGVGELLVLKAAHTWQLYAHANERSSHVQPTPSIGGVAFVLPVLVLLGYLTAVGYGNLLGLACGCALVAAVSLWDDLAELSPKVRLPIHLVSVALALLSLSGTLSGNSIGDSIISNQDLLQPDALSLWWLLPMGLAIAWHLNLFNFMDGIDGYAGSQCLLFALGSLLLTSGGAGWSGAVLHLLVGSSIGFLVYNWPPARIFMGDVGSSFLGLLIGVLVAQMALTSVQPLIASLILLAGFWFDASYTLCVRILTGQRFTQAHRSHLYQRLTDQHSHRWVTLAFWVFGACWLLPLAWLSTEIPGYAGLLLTFALMPLLYGCWRTKAGQQLQASEAGRKLGPESGTESDPELGSDSE